MKYIRITLTSNLGNFYAVAVASLFVDFLPMLPIQILLVNFLTDFPMIAISTDSVDEQELMRPVAYDTRSIALMTSYYGIVSTIADFLVFGIFFRFGPAILQTAWFIESVITELVVILSLRTSLPFYKATRPGKPILGISAIAILIALAVPFIPSTQRALHFTPISTFQLMIVGALIIFYFIMTESAKRFFTNFHNGKNHTIQKTPREAV